MNYIENIERPKKELYEFQGKRIESDPNTVKQLNFALASNFSSDRYVKINQETTEDHVG